MERQRSSYRAAVVHGNILRGQPWTAHAAMPLVPQAGIPQYGQDTGSSVEYHTAKNKCRLQSEFCKGDRKNDSAENPNAYLLIQQGLLK